MDKSICFGTTTHLQATFTGNSFSWSPVSSLLNANTLTPVAGPQETTTYYFIARDTSIGGCPKPVSDSVVIIVIQPLRVFAGNDTTIVAGQPLQLQATGAISYFWSPSIGMNNNLLANPIVTLPSNIEQISYQVRGSTPEGCSSFDSITVYQFKSLPDIFIPSAFTPDNDGRNDVLKPIVAGVKRFINFSVYNRWGQLMYSTNVIGNGWDGLFKGARQPPGTYVYEASAVDYLDKPLFRKGTVVLLR